MTVWDNIQVLMLFGLVPVLVALLLVALIRVLRPVAERSMLVRMLCRLIGMGAVTIVVVMSLWIVLVVLCEMFGSQAVEPWLPLGLPAVIGAGFYAWGRFAWRIKREKMRGPRCNRCGYDLAGLSLTPRPPCPECGKVLPANERKLFQPRIRKWATRLGAMLIAVGLLVPPAVSIYRYGWLAQVPNWVLLRMLVSNVHADVAAQALGQRNVSLSRVDPHWTRDLMVSFAEEYDAAAAGGATPPWTIYTRIYPLMNVASDKETVALASSWCVSPSRGRRVTASFVMMMQGFCPAEERVEALRPLLADPDSIVRQQALRGLTYDAALPLGELLAFIKGPLNTVPSREVGIALTYYSDQLARQARLELAANTADPNADSVTWGLLYEVIDLNAATVKAGGLTTLSRAKVVPPKAGTAWSSGRFDLVYRTLIDAAVATPGTDGEDPQTAVWCRAAMLSYATTTPSGVPGSPVSLKPSILLVLDDRIATTADAALRARLIALRNEISPADAPANGGVQDGSPGDK